LGGIKEELKTDLLDGLIELFEILEFHGLTQIKFSLDPERIKLMKMIIYLKSFLKRL
jgi:hypothetical protein